MRTDMVGYDEIVGDEIMGDDDSSGEELGEEFVGDDESSGASIDDLVGVWYPGKKKQVSQVRRGSAFATALANKQAREGLIVKQRSATRAREYYMPLGSHSFAAGETNNLTNRPQIVFRPERLFLTEMASLTPFAPTPGATSVLGIIIGKNPQQAANGAAPSSMFAANSFGVRLKMDTAQVSMDVIVTIVNNIGVAVTVSGALIGPAIE